MPRLLAEAALAKAAAAVLPTHIAPWLALECGHPVGDRAYGRDGMCAEVLNLFSHGLE